MILEKPVMNIVLDGKMYEFEYIKQNAVIAIPITSDLEKEIKQILFNKELRENLTINSRKFVKSFLNNQGVASKKLADVLRSY